MSRSACEMGEAQGGKIRGQIHNQPKFGLSSVRGMLFTETWLFGSWREPILKAGVAVAL